MNKIAIIALVATISGCSTYSASRYAVSVDNVATLRTMNGKTVNVGQFTAKEASQKEIMCRAVGPIKTPDGEPFSEFVRKALVDEMKLANIYSVSAPVTLTGNLDVIEFNSMGGSWDLALTVNSSNGKSLSAKETFVFTPSLYGETGCNQTAHAFMPAVQNLIGKVIHAPEFAGLITPK